MSPSKTEKEATETKAYPAAGRTLIRCRGGSLITDKLWYERLSSGPFDSPDGDMRDLLDSPSFEWGLAACLHTIASTSPRQELDAKSTRKMPPKNIRTPRPAVPLPKLRTMLLKALAAGTDASPNYLKPYAGFLGKNNLEDDGTPTPQTLSLYATYILGYIDPSGSKVEQYLSGTIHDLRTVFTEELQDVQDADLVKQALEGCKQLPEGIMVLGESSKRPLTLSHLNAVVSAYSQSHDLDDRLFVALFTVGFFGLLRLGELTDFEGLVNRKTTIRRDSLRLDGEKLSFTLPARAKTDSTGMDTGLCNGPDKVEMRSSPSIINPVAVVGEYVTLRDQRFHGSKWLWLTSGAEPPLRWWFTDRFYEFFGAEFGGDGGYSMRLGGATTSVRDGFGRDVVQKLGRWSSGAFQAYVRQHPSLQIPREGSSSSTNQ